MTDVPPSRRARPPIQTVGDPHRHAAEQPIWTKLPPRYQDGREVCAAPMGAAPLRYDAEGKVAWNELWTDFCDLALAGGPPHRGTLLEPATPETVRAEPEAYARVLAELTRGLRLVTGLPIVQDAAP